MEPRPICKSVKVATQRRYELVVAKMGHGWPWMVMGPMLVYQSVATLISICCFKSKPEVCLERIAGHTMSYQSCLVVSEWF